MRRQTGRQALAGLDGEGSGKVHLPGYVNKTVELPFPHMI
jgi:hypothetical protein